MSALLHELILTSAHRYPQSDAIKYKNDVLSYDSLNCKVREVCNGLLNHGLGRHERVAVYLPKCFEAVISFFATSMAGGIFIPVNPMLKPTQVAHILQDSNARFLITSSARAKLLEEALATCHDLHTLILIDECKTEFKHQKTLSWHTVVSSTTNSIPPPAVIDADVASILYTSGSTGSPKGVILSHRNMVAGAKSVAQYLSNSRDDRLLAVLPFSFDYGFSQLTTAFHVGACTVLMDYLMPRDVIRAVTKERITGLAAVPPLWIQLAQLTWTSEAKQSLRYLTNSGGALPTTTLSQLREALTDTDVILMYGLTEAFRSTYLPVEELDRRPNSMGKAIPNAEVMVVHPDGSPCATGEPGELVHRGALVALGYWNDPVKTAERFKPLPGQDSHLPFPEIAVWSGDTVRMDADGFLYFIGRNDEMIKTSGYRVSPSEVEEVIYASGLVSEVVTLGIPHPSLGQAIVAAFAPGHEKECTPEQLINECKQQLPSYMVPAHVARYDALPRNPNGKIDRKQLASALQNTFQE